MKRLMVLASLLVLLTSSFSLKKEKTKVLVFSLTKAYHHASIPAGIAAIQQLGLAHQFEVDTTTDAALFTSRNLRKYAAVVFMSTTGDVLNETQQ